MRFHIRDKSLPPDPREWQSWFAWYPVFAEHENCWVWLEYIWFRYHFKHYEYYWTEYRITI